MPSKGTPVRTLRVPDEVWTAAVVKAEARGETVSAVMLRLLRAWLAS